MYEALLPIVKNSYGQNSACLPSFLTSLQSAVKDLRQSYQTHHVQVDYGCCHIQAAYFLAYYPYYVQQTYHSLLLAAQHPGFANLINRPHLQALLLGSGPMPEAAALALYRQQSPQASSLKAISYDLHIGQWRSARRVTAQRKQLEAPSLD